MDKSKCESLIKKHLVKMMRELDINWSIRWKCSALSDCDAQINKESNYFDALITVDHEQIEDEDYLKKTLRHELLHTFTCEIDLLADQIQSVVSEKEYEILKKTIEHCDEMIVLRIERLLDSL